MEPKTTATDITAVASDGGRIQRPAVAVDRDVHGVTLLDEAAAQAGPDELAQLLEIRWRRLPVWHALVVAPPGPDPPTIRTDASTLRASVVIAASEQAGKPIRETHRVSLTGASLGPSGSRHATMVTW
jgi:hypothetical protein